MISKKNVFTAFFSIFSLWCFSQKDVIELPLKMQEGYGPFRTALGGMSPTSYAEDSPWKNTYPKIEKLPEGLSDLHTGYIETNIYQSVYQDYLAGNITADWYEKLQKSWQWIPDSLNLSPKNVKTKIAFAYGKDVEGNKKLVVDANNNSDLSDDPWLSPPDLVSHQGKLNALAKDHLLQVSVERYIGNEIVTVNIPVFIMYHSKLNLYMCNFYEYATTELEGETLAVCSGTFGDLSYNNVSLCPMGDYLENNKTNREENNYRKNEYLEVKGDIYRILGVNPNRFSLLLERIDQPKSSLVSTQIGYKTHAFRGEEFTTKKPVSLESLRGKYVLLDFWAVWCGPCIKELPHLKKVYEKADKSQFEIVGIVGNSPANALDELIRKESISWPQILSDDSNRIVEQYEVKSYPTTLLLNREGVIIAKNLRGESLEKKLSELLAD